MATNGNADQIWNTNCMARLKWKNISNGKWIVIFREFGLVSAKWLWLDGFSSEFCGNRRQLIAKKNNHSRAEINVMHFLLFFLVEQAVNFLHGSFVLMWLNGFVSCWYMQQHSNSKYGFIVMPSCRRMEYLNIRSACILCVFYMHFKLKCLQESWLLWPDSSSIPEICSHF